MAAPPFLRLHESLYRFLIASIPLAADAAAMIWLG
jgi:hypothetical protein